MSITIYPKFEQNKILSTFIIIVIIIIIIVVTNDLRHYAIRVRVCFFLVSCSFSKNYCGEFGLSKYCALRILYKAV